MVSRHLIQRHDGGFAVLGTVRSKQRIRAARRNAAKVKTILNEKAAAAASEA